MLSISQTEKLPPKLAVKASLKKRSHAAMFPSREEKINKVHQDEDFIYPTLGTCCSTITLLNNTYFFFTDQSDEEEVPLQKDESWNPKIKMSNLGPKMDRPVNFFETALK